MSLHAKRARRAAFRRYARLPDVARAAVEEAFQIAARAVANGLVDVINGRATMEEVRAHLEQRFGGQTPGRG